MAFPNLQLINALRETASRLANGAPYSWGHHGQCNCGNLAQVATSFSAAEIRKAAHEGAGEWTELAEMYCPVSKTPVNLLMQKLMDIGLTPSDLHHLEYLSDKTILRNLPNGFRWLSRNKREDVIAYFETMADVLETQLIRSDINNMVSDMKKEAAKYEFAEAVLG